MDKKEKLREFLKMQHSEPDKIYVDLLFDVANRYAQIQAVMVDLNNLKYINEILLSIENNKDILSCLPFDKNQGMLIRQSLWCTIIIGYAKLFVQGKVKLEVKHHLKGASPKLLKLHKDIMDLRHTYIAHGGRNCYEDVYTRMYIKINKNDGEIVAQLGHIGIKQFSASKNELEGVDKLINLLLINLKRKVDKLWKLVMEEVSKEPIENWVDKCENKRLLY